MMDESRMTDAELEARHGDHSKWSIRRWRAGTQAGATSLEYIDWRADKLWCEATDRNLTGSNKNG